MNYKKTLDFLYSLQKVGIKFGLENTKKLLDKFDNPHHKFNSIHIAGTNGKGSTSSFIASILHELGYKVGLYTSPHLVKFNERININGKLIEDEALIDYTNFIYKDILKIKPTFFEVTTAIALKYFADKNVDYAVLETGLGGRLDSTNVVLPKISVITSIGMDHQIYLGSSLEEITQEKGGIIKSGVPVIIGKNPENVKDILKSICVERKTTFFDVEENYKYHIIEDKFPTLNFICKSRFTNEEYFINSPLYGRYQIFNILNSISVLERITERNKSIKIEVEKGINNLQNNFKFQGRFQIIYNRPWIVLDTAHNSQAINFLLYEIDNIIVRKKIGVFGIMKDKNIDECILNILNSFDQLILCQAKIERALDCESLRNKFYDKDKINIGGTVEESIKQALLKASKEDLILVFGSNYIVGEAIEYFNRVEAKKILKSPEKTLDINL